MSTYSYTKFNAETAQTSLDKLMDNPVEENELGIFTDIETTFESYNTKYDNFLSGCIGELSSGGELYDYYSKANDNYNNLIEILNTAITEFNEANQNGGVSTVRESYTTTSTGGDTSITETTSVIDNITGTGDTEKTTNQETTNGEIEAGSVEALSDTLTEPNSGMEAESVETLSDALTEPNGEIVDGSVEALSDTLTEPNSGMEAGSVEALSDTLTEPNSGMYINRTK